jgi:hypothetical protein
MAKLDKMTMEELVASERAATTVRKHYEDKAQIFQGNFDNDERFLELNQKVTLLNGVRIKILNELERRLLNIEFND